VRIGVLTGGGDCPGLNAVIRAAVRVGEEVLGHQVIGYLHGWKGVIEGRSKELTINNTSGILHKGGTILGTSRVTPFMIEDGVAKAKATLKADNIDCLIVIGGEGTLGCAHSMANEGVNVVGVPKTIDNDIAETDFTFGFNTAVQVASDALDRLHTTAESHDRVMVVEVMGRHVGWIATYAGVSGGADVILIPEEPFDIDHVCKNIERRHNRGRTFSIVVVAEGALPKEGTFEVPEPEKDIFGHQKLGGIGSIITHEIEKRTGFESRYTNLGHVLRGGTPTAFDRVLATRLGVAAVEAASEKKFDVMVALKGTQIETVKLSKVTGSLKKVDKKFQAKVLRYFGG
jgi:phosphofructokinase-like protein